MLAAISRLVPHPPNFSPIAVFGGAQFADKRAAFFVPLAAMFLSDLIIGLHALIPVIYGSFALIVCLGFWVRRRPGVLRIASAAIIGACLFYATTNFGVWAFGTMYPKTFTGLVDCYAAALPFFQNSLLSDLFYSAVLFGGLAMAENYFPRLRERAAAA